MFKTVVGFVGFVFFVIFFFQNRSLHSYVHRWQCVRGTPNAGQINIYIAPHHVGGAASELLCLLGAPPSATYLVCKDTFSAVKRL